MSDRKKCCISHGWGWRLSVIFEAKDGKYGKDGSETLADEDNAKTPTPSSFSNSLGDLKKNIEYIIGMERQSGNINSPTPQDIARILNVPVEEVEAVMREMECALSENCKL